jgi:hypothetical protein
VGNDDANATPRTDAKNGLCQRLFALHIQVRIGLIEHNQERVAIKRSPPKEADGVLLDGNGDFVRGR